MVKNCIKYTKITGGSEKEEIILTVRRVDDMLRLSPKKNGLKIFFDQIVKPPDKLKNEKKQDKNNHKKSEVLR